MAFVAVNVKHAFVIDHIRYLDVVRQNLRLALGAIQGLRYLGKYLMYVVMVQIHFVFV
jgi:hypothetical protein